MHDHRARGSFAHFADRDRTSAGRVRAHRRQHSIGVGGRDHRNQLAFVRQIQRIEPEDFAGALHFLAQRQRRFADADADVGRVSEFVQHAGDAAAGGVAHTVDAGASGQHRRHQAVQRLAVALHVGLQRKLVARDQDGGSVVAEHAVDDEGDVARPRQRLPRS